MKKLILGAVLFSATLAACGGSDTPVAGFPQPAGTVAVNFTVDDSANKGFAAGNLQWKGAMVYDTVKRTIAADSTWGGPFATLYDDGPWTAGGHEPAGAVAGDHKWGITVFAKPPATGTDTYSYGLNDASQVKGAVLVGPNGWMWIGDNGSFSVASGATAAVTAPGLTLKTPGNTDIQIVIDTNALGTGTWDKTYITIKGNFLTWSRILLTPDAAGKATFVLSNFVGAGKLLPQFGLAASGDKPEFGFNFGTGDGVEYKDANKAMITTGITAGVRTGTSGAFTAATVAVNATNKNTYITIP